MFRARDFIAAGVVLNMTSTLDSHINGFHKDVAFCKLVLGCTSPAGQFCQAWGSICQLETSSDAAYSAQALLRLGYMHCHLLPDEPSASLPAPLLEHLLDIAHAQLHICILVLTHAPFFFLDTEMVLQSQPPSMTASCQKLKLLRTLSSAPCPCCVAPLESLTRHFAPLPCKSSQSRGCEPLPCCSDGPIPGGRHQGVHTQASRHDKRTCAQGWLLF